MTLEEYYNRPRDYKYYRKLFFDNDLSEDDVYEMLYSDILSDIDVFMLVVLIRAKCANDRHE